MAKMDNVKMRLRGDELVITIDLGKRGQASKSQKSIVIATTRGNVPIPEHADIKLGLNVFRKNSAGVM